MNEAADDRLRYVHRGVGLFVIAAIIIAAVAVLQSGRVERWLNPLQPIRIVLPQEGLYGLAAGSTVEILGTRAGEVQEIVIDPDQQIHARVLIRRDMRPFVRQDSEVFIRKRFGVAGDSYLEITRGMEQPLDWEYAVLEARADRAPTDLLQATLEELRRESVPVLQETRRAIAAYADLGEQMSDPQGKLQLTIGSLHNIALQLEGSEGVLGRLLSDKEFADEIQATLQGLNDDLERLGPLFEELQKTATNTTQLSEALAAQGDDLPQITARLTQNLDALQAVLADLRETTPRLPELADGLANATVAMPAVVVQAQSTLLELEKLAESLRSSWLLGGGGGDVPRSSLTSQEAAP